MTNIEHDSPIIRASGFEQLLTYSFDWFPHFDLQNFYPPTQYFIQSSSLALLLRCPILLVEPTPIIFLQAFQSFWVPSPFLLICLFYFFEYLQTIFQCDICELFENKKICRSILWYNNIRLSYPNRTFIDTARTDSGT